MPLIALLRGINVGGHRKLPMAELRQLAADLGYARPRTYIASGNLLIDTDEAPATVEARLEEAIAAHFGFPVDAIVRPAARWFAYADGGPFSDAEADRPRLLHLGLAKATPAADAAERLAPYLRGAERIAVIEDALWIDFAQGAGRSKITPKVLDRALGSPVTARNWRSVLALAALLGDAR